MADDPPKDEPGAQERFDRGIANALRTPPKPHKVAAKPAKAKRRTEVKDAHDR